MIHQNGAAPDLEQFAESLRQRLELEESQQAALRTRLDESNERVKRLRRSIAALIDEPPTPKETTTTKSTGERKPLRDETVERVFAAWVAHGEDATPTQVARVTEGLSTETALRAVPILREQGRLRLIGKARGGGRRYRLIAQPEVAPGVASSMWTPGSEHDG